MHLQIRASFLFLFTFLGLGLPSAYAAIFTVNTLNDFTTGSLRAAIFTANITPGPDSIRFSVAGVIDIAQQLPAIEDSVVVDGTSAPGYVACGAPVVALNYTGGAGAHGLLILAGGAGTTIKALNIRGFTAAGVSSEFSSRITVQSCYIGTDLTGNVAMPNYLGVFLLGSPDCVVGGDECDRNVISAQANGIAMELGSHRPVVAGNYVGLGADGVTLLGIGLEGIYAYDSDSVQIGLLAPNMGNVVVGCGAQGIHLNGSGNGCPEASIYNNWVGTNGTDSTGYGNLLNGILLEGGTSGAYIGNWYGPSLMYGNHIAYNGLNGIQLDSLSNSNLILGNSIYCNAEKGIYLYFANGLIPTVPNLTSEADSVSGSGGIYGNMVHVYRNLTIGTGADSSFCDCEGEEYIGQDSIDAQGNWSVLHGLNLTPAEQASVTATQVDLSGNTSEFFPSCAGTPVGVAVKRMEDALTIYPNPTAGVFRVELDASFIDAKQVKVYDAFGSLIHEAVAEPSTPIQIDAAAWCRGIYIIQVETATGSMSRRLVIQ